jgi:DNA polymerase IV (DinB-like DNA polymerase)
VIFHIDFDYFYAQCEEIRLPELKSKPVCVCVYSDRGNGSGAIATSNYIARKFGVRSGMPISLAKKKLEINTEAVFLPVDFTWYLEISEKAMNIMKENADIFEYVGKDEAYLDVTERVKGDFHKANELAMDIKNTIRDKVKLSCSVGIAPNKLIAKIASDFRKPDGLTIIPVEKIEEFLAQLKIRDIPGIGKKTEECFKQLNLETIKDLKNLDIFTLNNQVGKKNGIYIFNAVRGLDEEPVKERHVVQFSKIVTLKKDSKDIDFLLQSLSELCKNLHEVIQKNRKMFKSVGIQLVLSDLSNKTKSRMLKNHTSSLEELEKNAEYLLKDIIEEQTTTIRRLGVKVSDLLEISGQNQITNYF